MKKDTCFLHIGQYKTGTTSIQRSLYDNVASLAEQGVWYPIEREEYCYDAQHGPLVASIFGVRDEYLPDDPVFTTARPLELFFNDLDGVSQPNALISAEGFYAKSNQSEALRTFAQRLSERFDNIKVIVYVRRHDDWYVSLMQQHIRAGIVVTDDALVTLGHPHYQIARQLSYWEDVFGIENIVVRPFVRDRWKNNDLLDDFYAQIGVDSTRLTRGKDRNLSMTYHQMVFLNELNKKLVPLSAFHSGRRRDNHELRALLLSFSDVLREGVPGDFLDCYQRKEILDMFKEDIDLLNEKYGGGTGEIIPREIEIKKRSRTLNDDDVIALVKRLLIEIRELRKKLRGIG